MRLPIGLAVLLALAAVPAVTAPAHPGHAEAAAADDGQLVVRERQLQGGGTFIEGAISYLAVKRLSDGRVVLRRRYEGLIRLDRALAPGRYRVSSYVRSCSGTCDRLDPPTNRCATSVRVRSRSTVRLTVVSRDDRACRFERP